MTLDRLNGLLQDKKNQQRKSQLPLSGEILRAHRMASKEKRVAQFAGKRLDKFDEIGREIGNDGLHPQVNGGKVEPVQAKLLYNNILCLIQWQWGPGEGSLRVVYPTVPSVNSRN